MKLLLAMLLPFAELLLGAHLAETLGGLWVLAGLLLGVVTGVALMRWRGRVFFGEAMAALNRQQMPSEALVGGIAWYLAGALLILPGFISDALALLLLLPPVRRRLLDRFRRLAEERLVQMQGTTGFYWSAGRGWQAGPGDGRVFDGEAEVVVQPASEAERPRLPPADPGAS